MLRTTITRTICTKLGMTNLNPISTIPTKEITPNNSDAICREIKRLNLDAFAQRKEWIKEIQKLAEETTKTRKMRDSKVSELENKVIDIMVIIEKLKKEKVNTASISIPILYAIGIPLGYIIGYSIGNYWL